MSATDEGPWIFAGNCPICQSGLRRIRVCETAPGILRGYVMCDECEAIWHSPDVSSAYRFPHAEKPECPVSEGPLYGPQSRWATMADVQTIGWMDQVTIDSSIDPHSDVETIASLVVPEDTAGDLDALPTPQSLSPRSSSEEQSTDLLDVSCPTMPDTSYGSDEPRPGC